VQPEWAVGGFSLEYRSATSAKGHARADIDLNSNDIHHLY